MPVYNAGPRLEPAVRSILAQTLIDLELIAVDDGSTDGSGDVLDSIAREDARVIVVHRPNGGLSAALNQGIAQSTSDLVALMDSDDWSHPQRLERQVDFLGEHTQCAVVGCGLRIVNAEGRLLRLDPVARWNDAPPRSFHGRFDVGGPTLVLRREALRAIGGYRLALNFANDYDLVLRLVDAGYRLDNVEERLYDYVIHPQQMTMVTGAEQRLAVVAADISREIRRRRLADPLDQARDLCLSEREIAGLPRDLRSRLLAVRAIASHLSACRAAHRSGIPWPDPWDVLRGLGPSVVITDVMVGVHRHLFWGERSAGWSLRALLSGVLLAMSRRRTRVPAEDVFLPSEATRSR